ncbi:unnamed protein product [Lota lota]
MPLRTGLRLPPASELPPGRPFHVTFRSRRYYHLEQDNAWHSANSPAPILTNPQTALSSELMSSKRPIICYVSTAAPSSCQD